ncbi:MAG: short-chain dehydrogenase, partial [Terricaulis sp.]|nr:short-chain dehydrogenase [Terricaulis sp.]
MADPEHTAQTQRDLQSAQDHKPKPEDEHAGAVQAGARRYPEPPFPPQHQPKPGDESRLEPAP